MPKEKSSQLDFKTDYPEYGVRAPLLSSENVKWNGFSLEHHLQPKLEISEHYHTQHMISIHLDRQPKQLEIGMDENHQDVIWQPGDIFIVPAYVNHALAWRHNSEFMMLCIEPDTFTQSLNEIVGTNPIDLIPHFTKSDPLIHQFGLTLKTDLETGMSGSRLYTDAIIFGSPTYMGGVAAQFKAFIDNTLGAWVNQQWKDKIAGGFTHSGSPSGDKQGTLLYLAINAAQHSMIWVGSAEMLDANGVNRLGSYMGVMGQSPYDASGAPVTIDDGDYLR